MYLYWLTRFLPFWWGVGSVYLAALLLDWAAVLLLAAWEHGFSWSKHPCTKWGVPIFMPLIPASEMACMYHVHHVPAVFAGLPWNGGVLLASLIASSLMEISTYRRVKVWHWYKRHHAFIFTVLLTVILAAFLLALFYAEHATIWKVTGLTSAVGYLSLLGLELWLTWKKKLPPHEYMGRRLTNALASSD